MGGGANQFSTLDVGNLSWAVNDISKSRCNLTAIVSLQKQKTLQRRRRRRRCRLRFAVALTPLSWAGKKTKKGGQEICYPNIRKTKLVEKLVTFF